MFWVLIFPDHLGGAHPDVIREKPVDSGEAVVAHFNSELEVRRFFKKWYPERYNEVRFA